MSRVPVILQTAETDCGPACVASLLRFGGRKVGLAQVRNVMDPGRDGASALVIRQAAGEWGMDLKALLAGAEELATNMEQLPLPLVLHLSRQHYVVVERVRGNTVEVMDPAVGRRKLTRVQVADEASGLVLVVANEQTLPVEEHPADQRRRPFALLRQVLTTVRADLGRAALLSSILAVGGLALPVATAMIVDAMVADGLQQQRWLAIGIGLAVILGLFSWARYWVLATLQYRLAGNLSNQVAGTLFTRQLRFFDRRSIGDLSGRVESAHAIHSLLSVTLLGAALDAVLTMGYLLALLVIAPQLALSTGMIITACMALSLWVAKRCAALRREEILVMADSSTLLVDSVSGMGTLRAYGSESGALGQWQELLQNRLRLTRMRTRLNALSLALLAAMAVATPLVILVQASSVGGAGFFNDITPGTALGLMALAAATLTPVTSLATQLVNAADLRPLLDRVEDLESAQAERTGGKDPGQLSGAISLRSVGFKHDRYGMQVLDEISGEILAGSKIGILGPTGCGKSTLLQLLAGLHTPTAGQVLFDGQDLAELDLQAVRSQIGVVFQENWLPRGTIREAVLANREGFTDEKIWKALYRAQLAEEIQALPMGLETQLGSGGTGLSGGQRQRLGLARALLADPKILILDEPTSALDGETERKIETVLAELQITRIIITHRLDITADADQLWVMDGGRIIERGSCAELAANGGWYSQLLQGRVLT